MSFDKISLPKPALKPAAKRLYQPPVEVTQAPTTSASTAAALGFEKLNLSQPILKALAKCGYLEPTAIQEQAIPAVMAGKDIVAKAPTGTGKTAAFVLPALERLIVAKARTKSRILILTPTRELANQITDVVFKYGKELRVNAISILGGMPYREQLRKLNRPNDIIVATPGRLIDYMQRGSLDFSAIEMLVLDEADRMLDMGFIDDVEYIVSALPKQRQTLLFTATMDEKLLKLTRNILKSPQRIEVAHKKANLDNIGQRVHMADDSGHKSRLLQHLLSEENVYKAIIFSATKRNADELARQLRDNGHAAHALHGDMNQHKRNKAIMNFRQGKTQLLIATDVAARGIDINDVTHVINYDLPKFAEDYVHRIGRTGRAGKTGMAISLVLASDYGHLKRIERFTGHAIPCETIVGLEPKKPAVSSKPKHTKKYSNNRNKPGFNAAKSGRRIHAKRK